jgi:hypothetical protein
VLLHCSTKYKGKHHFQTSYETSITLKPKSDKNTTKRKISEANFFGEHRWKYPQKDTCKLNSTTY